MTDTKQPPYTDKPAMLKKLRLIDRLRAMPEPADLELDVRKPDEAVRLPDAVHEPSFPAAAEPVVVDDGIASVADIPDAEPAAWPAGLSFERPQ